MSDFVTVVIACRNEEKYIAKCLDSFIAQDYPKEKLEILVVDGMSEDATVNIVKMYQLKYSYIKLLQNPRKFTNFAVNIGIKQSQGDIIMIAGAHADYGKTYITKAIENLNKSDVDVVGGSLKTIAANNTISARAIALLLSGNLGTGGSRFRNGSDKPQIVDTVFGGCYKKEVFTKVGFFNENLKRSQDMELSMRLSRAGGKILLDPEMVASYYPSANFKNFFIHNFKDGIWAIYPFKFTGKLFKLRHYAPLILVSGFLFWLIAGLFFNPFLYIFYVLSGCYILLLFYAGIQVSLSQKDVRYLYSIPTATAIRHFAYGFGSLFGIIKLFTW